MVARTVTIYEVPNSYASGGGGVAVQGVHTLTFEDSDDGPPDVLASSAGTIADFDFLFDDTSLVGGLRLTVKTVQLTIGGALRTFIMNEAGEDIPGAGVGSPVQLDTLAAGASVGHAGTPYLAAGTRVATDHGDVAVEDLEIGTHVRTCDNGFQPIRWIGTGHLSRDDLLARPGLAPVQIAPGAFGQSLPSRQLIISPQHSVLLKGWDLSLNFACEEALAPAGSLVGRPGIRTVMPEDGLTFYHILLDRHEIIFTEGLPTESFFIGDTIRAGMGADRLAEIMELFPQLGRQYGPLSETARMILRANEVGMLDIDEVRTLAV